LAVKHGLDVLAGVIDQDYTGELKVVLVNTDMRLPFHIKPGYRIAQLVMEMYIHGDVVEVQGPPPPTERGDSGFGSSGLAPAPSVQQHYKVTGV
jgi:dUTP pyrophosphatase